MKVKKAFSFVVAITIIFTISASSVYASEEEISDGTLIRYSGNEKVYIIPGNVRIIAENAFENCEQLEEICIGENVELIQSGAFMNCPNLKTICFSDTNSIAFGDSIADKDILFLVNNENKGVRKSIAMSGYNWATFYVCKTFGKTVIAFLYGEMSDFSRNDDLNMIIDKYLPDYLYFDSTNVYYYSTSLSAGEVNYAQPYNPGLFVKVGVMLKTWNMPEKQEIESGNDGAKNGIKRLLNALIKIFR